MIRRGITCHHCALRARRLVRGGGGGGAPSRRLPPGRNSRSHPAGPASRSIHVHPRPVPALDLAYESHDDDYDHDGRDGGRHGAGDGSDRLRNSAGASSSGGASALAGAGGTGPGATGGRNGRRFSAAGGGGGGGPFKCPKCGSPGEFFFRGRWDFPQPAFFFFLRRTKAFSTSFPCNLQNTRIAPVSSRAVTFQESSTSAGRVQSNCFYCAGCSGWFLIQPDLEAETTASSAGGKHAHQRQEGGGAGASPGFVMQHVS